jgi:hypothetical protein
MNHQFGAFRSSLITSVYIRLILKYRLMSGSDVITP